jgi:hypothetical protein
MTSYNRELAYEAFDTSEATLRPHKVYVASPLAFCVQCSNGGRLSEAALKIY